MHIVLLHADLGFSGETARALETTKVLLALGHRVSVVASEGSRRWAFEELDVSVHCIELPEHPHRSPFAALRAAHLLRELEPQRIHATSERLAPLLAALGPLLPCTYLLEVHRTVRGRVPRSRTRLQGVLFSAPTLGASLAHPGGLARSHLRLVPHAPQLEPPDPGTLTAFDAVAETSPSTIPHDARPPSLLRSMTTPSKGPSLIGAAGRLDGDQDIETLIEAFRILVLAGRDVHLAVLGEGPDEQRLRRHVRERGLADRATVGIPVTAEAAPTLWTFDVHVSCRLVGGPDWLTHVALALGKPTILPAVGEAFHLVEEERGALLVAPGDVVELSRALERLLDDPTSATDMGREGRDELRRLHPPASFVAALESAYALPE